MEVRLKPLRETAKPPPINNKFSERSRIFNILAYIQIVVGVLCIINAILCICLQTSLGDTAYGIWCGLIFALAGGCGVGAVKNGTKCMIISFMVLSVLSALLFAPVVILMAASEFRYDAAAHWKEYTDVDPKTGDTFTYWKTKDPGGLAVKKALHVFMVICGLVEGVVAVVCSILCCMTVCADGPPKRSKAERGGAVTYQLLLTIPRKDLDPDNEGPPYAREAVITFPGPSKPAPEQHDIPKESAASPTKHDSVPAKHEEKHGGKQAAKPSGKLPAQPAVKQAAKPVEKSPVTHRSVPARDIDDISEGDIGDMPSDKISNADTDRISGCHSDWVSQVDLDIASHHLSGSSDCDEDIYSPSSLVESDREDDLGAEGTDQPPTASTEDLEDPNKPKGHIVV